MINTPYWTNEGLTKEQSQGKSACMLLCKTSECLIFPPPPPLLCFHSMQLELANRIPIEPPTTLCLSSPRVHHLMHGMHGMHGMQGMKHSIINDMHWGLFAIMERAQIKW